MIYNFQNIKNIAASKGLTLKSLAEQAGITRQAIYDMVQRNSTKQATIEKICKVLDVPISTFYDDANDLLGDQNQNELKMEVDKLNEEVRWLRKQLDEKTEYIEMLKREITNLKDVL